MKHSRERYQFVLALKRGLEIIDSKCLTDEEASAVVNTVDVACKVLKVSLRINEIESILPEVEEGSLTMEMLNESLRVNKLLVMAYSAELTTAMEKK